MIKGCFYLCSLIIYLIIEFDSFPEIQSLKAELKKSKINKEELDQEFDVLKHGNVFFNIFFKT